MSHRLTVAVCVLSCALIGMTPISGVERSRSGAPLPTASRLVVVTSAEELVAALATDIGGLTILVRRGIYQLDHAIQVPDDTELIGEGTMLYDDTGLPTGFVPETRTVIAAEASVTGDFLTLGDGASIQNLVLQDIAGRVVTGGAVVAVVSGAPGDAVSAKIIECDIVNPNPLFRAPSGPTGRGLLAMTWNPHLTTGDLPHEQAFVSVHLTQSIIRSPAGGIGIFGVNFAGLSTVELHLTGNVIGGGLDAAGAASRPDSVEGARMTVHSRGNLYRPDSATYSGPGWILTGGADAPYPGLIAEDTLNNKLMVRSIEDRIEGFVRAISAEAGRRASALSGASSFNALELILENARLASTREDFWFYGARSDIAGMPAGDGNELRVTMRHVIGSGSSKNEYDDALPTLGSGNRFTITGNLRAFSQTNHAILPEPDDHHFTAER